MKSCIFLICLLFSHCKCSWTSRDSAQAVSALTTSSIQSSVKNARPTLLSILKILTDAPHPAGSDRQHFVARELEKSLNNLPQIKTMLDRFDVAMPNPVLLDNPQAPAPVSLNKKLVNIYAALPKTEASTKRCAIALASHFDTKILPNGAYVGANDSASSTAALVTLAKVLGEFTVRPCDIYFWFFDGEEALLFDWSAGLLKHPAKTEDNTYGSRHLAGLLSKCTDGFCVPESQIKNFALSQNAPIKAMILMDMIGSKNIQISRDNNSNPELLKRTVQIAKTLNFNKLFSTHEISIDDDHLPFKKLGIPVLNLIDFENLSYWHRPGDTLETISFESIEKVTTLVAHLVAETSKIQ